MQNSLEYWQHLTKSSINYDIHEMDDVVAKVASQLLYDQLNNQISSCAIACPRLNSSIDKKTRIAHRIAHRLFPTQENVTSYINYTKLLSKLKKQYEKNTESQQNETLQLKESDKNPMCEFKKARTDRKLWCELGSKKQISDVVKNPVPMPVTVAPFEELEPFFNFMTCDTSVPENLDNKLDAVINTDQNGAKYIAFKRGAFYSDGRIDMCKQVVGPNWIGKLTNSIKNNPNVEHFLIGNNIVNTEGAIEISKYIAGNNKSKIKTWYLAGNCIDGDAIEIIADALKTDKYAKSLWLKRNPLSSLGGIHLGNMLTANTVLKTLDLNNTALLDRGVKHLFKGLQENNTLRHLYLDANGITVNGAVYIANYFDHVTDKKKYGLSSLWIEMNQLGNAGITMIANSLKNNTKLRRLAVGSNRLEAEGIKNLCEALVDHPKLIMLFMGMYKSTADMKELGNSMMDEGAKYVAEFIRNNKTVKIMSVLHNNITNDGINELCDAIMTNDTLLFMEYEQYEITIDHTMRKKITNKLNDNCLKRGMSYTDFVNNKLRFMKHTKNIRYIDSIYRNKM